MHNLHCGLFITCTSIREWASPGQVSRRSTVCSFSRWGGCSSPVQLLWYVPLPAEVEGNKALVCSSNSQGQGLRLQPCQGKHKAGIQGSTPHHHHPHLLPPPPTLLQSSRVPQQRNRVDIDTVCTHRKHRLTLIDHQGDVWERTSDAPGKDVCVHMSWHWHVLYGLC